MPFTDPMADGPAIQRAGQRALDGGQTMDRTLAMVRAFRDGDAATPVVLMGYYNPIYSRGVERFLAEATAAGVDGLIIVDLPPEEDDELCLPAQAAGLNFIRLATPTTDDRRLPRVLTNTSGFVYYVSITGITGAAAASAAAVAPEVARIKARDAAAGLRRLRHPHPGGRRRHRRRRRRRGGRLGHRRAHRRRRPARRGPRLRPRPRRGGPRRLRSGRIASGWSGRCRPPTTALGRGPGPDPDGGRSSRSGLIPLPIPNRIVYGRAARPCTLGGRPPVQSWRSHMAETPVLEAVARAGVGKGAARSARREGFVPGVIYGGGAEPQPINVKFNTLLKQLKAGRFLSTLINVKVDGTDNNVICRSVQRDVVKDLPTHVDFLRLSEKSRIALYIPVEYVNRDKSPGLKRGGVLTEVRPEVELMVTAGDIPERLVVDLTGTRHPRLDPHLERDAAGRRPADDHRPRLRDRQHPGAVGPARRGERDRGRRGRGLIRARLRAMIGRAAAPRRVSPFGGTR